MSKRVGWIKAQEMPLADAAPPDQGYLLSIVGPVGICELAERNWLARDNGRIIFNTGYGHPSVEANEAAEHLRATTVHWEDREDVDSTAVSFLELRKLCEEALSGRPNGSVLIDSTALSKSLQIALLGMLIRTRSARSIDLLYRLIDYSYGGTPLVEVYATDLMRQRINDISFSLMGVPYVEGKYHSERRRHVILLVGLDYQRILSKVRELEPASIDVVIEAEALQKRPSAELFDTLCEQLDVGPENITTLPRLAFLSQIEAIRSAIARAKALTLQPFVIAAGGKPGALAAALQSVVESEVPVLVSIPDRVVQLDQRPAGPLQLYRLDDPTGF